MPLKLQLLLNPLQSCYPEAVLNCTGEIVSLLEWVNEMIGQTSLAINEMIGQMFRVTLYTIGKAKYW